MIQTFQYKLYPNQAQSKTLERWLGVCCWVYNRALEHRKKAYLRRAEHTSYNDQQAMLTGWRTRMDSLRAVPCVFERDALRRVDRGMKAFFRRLKAGGEKPGFPRFRSRHRYNSLECLAVGKYLLGNGTDILDAPHSFFPFSHVMYLKHPTTDAFSGIPAGIVVR